MERDQQITLLRYWAAQASGALDDIAFILAFEKVRVEWVEAEEDKKSERFVPELDPVLRVAVGTLLRADTALILFVSKAIDTDGQSAGLFALKNAILQSEFKRPEHRENIIDTFRQLNSNKQPLLRIRNKLTAHIDFKELLCEKTESYLRRQLIGDAREIIGLARCLLDNAPVVLDSSGRPLRENDNTLIIRSEKFAMFDAEAFWRAMVQRWYKQ